jgi:hypothetical protein
LAFVAGQFGDVGQLAVYQQVSDFLELAAVGEIEHVIAAVMQVVAGAANGAQCGVAGGGTAQGDGFLRLEARGWFQSSSWSSPYLLFCVRGPDAIRHHDNHSRIASGLQPYFLLAANSASSFCSKAW